MKLSNRSVLITGASRGLGKALAIELSKQGARVVLAARHLAELKTLEREIRSMGGTAFAISSDVSSKESIYPLAAQAAELIGPLDILINNASTLGPVPLELLSDTECEDFEKALATNLLGPFRLTKAVVGSMILRGSGLILNISSDASVNAYPTWGAYSVTKAALDHLTRIWAEELKDTHVKFLSIDPGEMNTQMHAEAVPDADRGTLADPSDVARRIASIIEESDSVKSGSRL